MLRRALVPAAAVLAIATGTLAAQQNRIDTVTLEGLWRERTPRGSLMTSPPFTTARVYVDYRPTIATQHFNVGVGFRF